MNTNYLNKDKPKTLVKNKDKKDNKTKIRIFQLHPFSIFLGKKSQRLRPFIINRNDAEPHYL